MPINLSTRELTAFVTLAEQRSFTRAAALTHLSQPAFSALIRALEHSVGARLFDRTTRSVELTVEGAVFVESARRVLRAADDALEDVRDRTARRRGRVSIAVLPALAAGWLPPLLAAFRAENPNIELDVADVLSEACIERVRSGRADFALASTRAESPELVTETFCTDRFHVVCRGDHPLAARKGAITPLALAPYPIVQLSRPSSVRQCVEAALYPAPLRTVMELDQLSTVAGMVRAGIGITIVPTLTLFHFAHAELVTRPLEARQLLREVFVVQRRDRSLGSAARRLYEILVEARPVMPDEAAAKVRRRARRTART
jgi:LysR family transcriptional regulator, carnitine catabolism transcriptional activator